MLCAADTIVRQLAVLERLVRRLAVLRLLLLTGGDRHLLAACEEIDDLALRLGELELLRSLAPAQPGDAPEPLQRAVREAVALRDECTALTRDRLTGLTAPLPDHPTAT